MKWLDDLAEFKHDVEQSEVIIAVAPPDVVWHDGL
jgi:hypothetical protein